MGKKKMTLAEIALLADAYKALRDKRLELKRQVEALEDEEKLTKNQLIDILQQQGVNGVEGKLCRVSLKTSINPLVVDWDKLDAYILETQDLSLLQRRLGVGAVREHWDAGDQLPGVVENEETALSVRKI
jgi:Na+-translocating ferredoxin:NAD+ oxidoreductase RnfC subunit